MTHIFKDLTIPIDDYIVNIRVGVVVDTDKGIVFEKAKEGYCFLIGGRVKVNESSLDAACRELSEEINIKRPKMELIALIENFFVRADGKKTHEINFIYRSHRQNLEDLGVMILKNTQHELVTIRKEELKLHDVRPKVLVSILQSTDKFTYIINRETNE